VSDAGQSSHPTLPSTTHTPPSSILLRAQLPTCDIFHASQNSAAFTLLESDTFWLSREPFKPGSHFPGAGTPRLATFALFQPLPSIAAPGKHDEHGDIRNVALINTHLDHVSDDQRKLGAAMVLHRARYEALKRPGVTVFVTGDLNRCICLSLSLLFQFSVFLIISATSTRPSMTRCDLVIIMFYVIIIFSSASGSDSGAYAVLTGTLAAPAVPDEFSRRFPLDSNPAGSSSEGEKGLLMRDMRYAAPRASVGGQWATFTGFDNRKEDEVCIDFVLGRSDGVGWCVSSSPLSFLNLGQGSHGGGAGRRRACLSRRRFQMMECSPATIVPLSRMSSFVE
jgi:hypothetical protein